MNPTRATPPSMQNYKHRTGVKPLVFYFRTCFSIPFLASMVLVIVLYMLSFSLALHAPIMLTMLSLWLHQSVFCHGWLTRLPVVHHFRPLNGSFCHIRASTRKNTSQSIARRHFEQKKWLSLLQLTIKGEVCVCLMDSLSLLIC